MSLNRFVWARIDDLRCAIEKRRAQRVPALADLPADDWGRSLADPTGFYLDCVRFFQQRLPNELRKHRSYFTQARRGFGADSFHVMWWMLFQKFRPANFLEIGVYRGQTISLISLLAKRESIACEVHGISPFNSAGDAVSRYLAGLDYHADTLANFRHFGLPEPKLLRALFTDAAARELIRSRPWPAIYIDGNHDYEVARADWELCSANTASGGIVALDDSGLSSAYRAPRFATGGHPGPSQLAREIDRSRFREILQVDQPGFPARVLR